MSKLLTTPLNCAKLIFFLLSGCVFSIKLMLKIDLYFCANFLLRSDNIFHAVCVLNLQVFFIESCDEVFHSN